MDTSAYHDLLTAAGRALPAFLQDRRLSRPSSIAEDRLATGLLGMFVTHCLFGPRASLAFAAGTLGSVAEPLLAHTPPSERPLCTQAVEILETGLRESAGGPSTTATVPALVRTSVAGGPLMLGRKGIAARRAAKRRVRRVVEKP